MKAGRSEVQLWLQLAFRKSRWRALGFCLDVIPTSESARSEGDRGRDRHSVRVAGGPLAAACFDADDALVRGVPVRAGDDPSPLAFGTRLSICRAPKSGTLGQRT